MIDDWNGYKNNPLAAKIMKRRLNGMVEINPQPGDDDYVEPLRSPIENTLEFPALLSSERNKKRKPLLAP